MTAIVLAGGKGTRIGHVFPNLPKPLIEVAGEPFLYWVMRWLKLQGEHSVILAAGHMADQLTQCSAAYANLSVTVCIEPQPLGTGGAVVHAAAHFPDEEFIVLNGDSLILAAIGPAFGRFCRSANLQTMLVAVEVPDATRFGSIAVGEDGLLSGFFEKRPGAGLANAGVYFLRRELLNLQAVGPCSMEYELLPRWLAQGARIAVAVTQAPFLDIGTPETLRLATGFILEHRGAFEDAGKLWPLSIPAMDAL